MIKPAPTNTALASLKALQCKVFGKTHNPDHVRTGAKYLRQRLQGPSMLNYYPKTVNFRALLNINAEVGRLTDMREVQRLKDVERKKMLGKGPPKKGKSSSISLASAWIVVAISAGCILELELALTITLTPWLLTQAKEGVLL